MAWYWIVAIILGSLLAWAVTSAIMYKYTDFDDAEALSSGLLLPLMFPLSIVIWIYSQIKNKI